ncbi:hypothetical protein ACQ4PT_051576 [Festuca glaucescens]
MRAGILAYCTAGRDADRPPLPPARLGGALQRQRRPPHRRRRDHLLPHRHQQGPPAPPAGAPGQRIVGITDGLLILLDTRSTVIRVVHPFTRAVVELPHLATFVRFVINKQKSFTMDSVVWRNATVWVASPSSIAVVIWFPNMPVVICAQPGSNGWKIIHTRTQFSNTVTFNGGLYGVTRVGRQVERVYPSLWSPWEQCLLPSCTELSLFMVDLPRRELTRVTSLGDRALFVSRDWCLRVSSRDLLSISGNSVHFARPGEDPVTVFLVDDGSFESTCTVHGDAAPVTRH